MMFRERIREPLVQFPLDVTDRGRAREKKLIDAIWDFFLKSGLDYRLVRIAVSNVKSWEADKLFVEYEIVFRPHQNHKEIKVVMVFGAAGTWGWQEPDNNMHLEFGVPTDIREDYDIQLPRILKRIQQVIKHYAERTVVEADAQQDRASHLQGECEQISALADRIRVTS